MAAMWQAWEAGDRAAALAAIPEGLIDDLFLYGSPAEISARIKDYVDAGVTTPVLAIMPAVAGGPAFAMSAGEIGRAYAKALSTQGR